MKVAPILLIAAFSVFGCEYEKRPIGPDRPLSPPTGAADARIQFYDNNAWQMANGSREFTWYGCGDCHSANAEGFMSLSGGRQVAFETIYQAISNGAPAKMPAYGRRMPVESIWQITAYVRSLRALKDTKRQRADLDQKGEATGAKWSGPVQ